MRSTTMIAIIACVVSLAKGAPPPPGGVQGYPKGGDERLEQLRQDRDMKTRLDRAKGARDQPSDEVTLSCALSKCTYDAYIPSRNAKALAPLSPRLIKKDDTTFIAFERNEDNIFFDTVIDYGFYGGVKSFGNARLTTSDKSPATNYHFDLNAGGQTPEAMIYCTWKNTECDYSAEPRIIRGPKRTVVKYPIVGAGFDKELPKRLLGGDHGNKEKGHKAARQEAKDARQIRKKQGL